MQTKGEPLLRSRRTQFGRRTPYILLMAIFAFPFFAITAHSQSGHKAAKPDFTAVTDVSQPEANPGRPTVSNPATLTPVGYLQFESGTLAAGSSSEFSSQYQFSEVVKLAVSKRLAISASATPIVHSTVNGTSGNDTAEVFMGAQAVFFPGKGSKPTLSASYTRRMYEGTAPDSDVGSPRNSATFYASADVRGFHYDANAIFSEVLNGPVSRLQFGQTLAVSHALGKGFGLSGEIWRFSQPFARGNAIGNLWAASYGARKNLVFDAGFDKGLTGTSTRWEAFAGFTYLLPRKLWRQ
jgi:hypothetical protein